MLNKAKICVLVSGGGTNLGALISAEREGIIKSGRISLVISNKPDAYALTRAKNAGIPTAVFEKKTYPSSEAFETDVMNKIDSEGIDIIVLAGFMCILSEKFTSHYKDRIINVHPSLIPSFCGAGFYGLKVHEAALAYGVKVSGATVHFVNEIPDGGKIIMQKAVEVQEGDTPEILQKRIMEEAEWKILPLSCEKVCKELIESEETNNG